MAFKNNFFTFDDFLAILGEIRHKINFYRSEKHTLLIQDVQGLRDDLAVLNAQLSDIEADLYGEEIDTARTYRYKLLERTQEIEAVLRSTKDENGNKWTDIANRARYQAEIECIELRAVQDSASATNRLAYNLCRVTIPKVLDSLSSRIAILVRAIDPKGEFKPMESLEDNNPWAGMSVMGTQAGVESYMEDLSQELNNLENK